MDSWTWSPELRQAAGSFLCLYGIGCSTFSRTLILNLWYEILLIGFKKLHNCSPVEIPAEAFVSEGMQQVVWRFS